MARNGLYKKGDFVQYSGNHTVMGGPLQAPGIGRIDDFEEQHGIERIHLFLLDRETHIWCDYERIRPIETEEKHLLASGYTLETITDRKRYRRGTSLISGGLILIPQLELAVMTGYCVADFTAGIASAKYLHKEGEFDLKLFHEDYAPVHDINDLFDYLKSKELQLDWEGIASL